MNKHFNKILFFGLVGLLLSGCAAQMQVPLGSFSPKAFPSGHYAPKVDNFMVILDASSSMGEMAKDQVKFVQAKALLDRMNQTLPELKLNGALRTFGHSPQLTRSNTKLFYGLTGYTQEGFKSGLDKVSRAGGTTPMTMAMNAASQDLASVAGKIAVIIVGDGIATDNSPLMSAKAMKAEFGDRLCIYTVHVGGDPAGKAVMESIAKAGQCGFAADADDIMSADGMADFVEKVFLTRYIDSDGDGVFDYMDKCPGTPSGVKVDGNGCPLDTDGDGVYDYMDKCPDTPKGVKVDKVGCPLDTDGDGVYDYMDKCPGTPAGAKVNAQGCWILGNILFDTDKSVIKQAAYPLLDEVVKVLKNNSELKVSIDGHTDNTAPAAYNMGLSLRRAVAVQKYLISKGIDARRLVAGGYGLMQPIASNETDGGRALNRRVEISPFP